MVDSRKTSWRSFVRLVASTLAKVDGRVIPFPFNETWLDEGDSAIYFQRADHAVVCQRPLPPS